MTCDYTDTPIFVNSIGVAFRATITTSSGTVMDVSTATLKQLWFKPPDSATITKTASFHTDGTDGIIQYVSESGFLSVPGKWRMQGYIEINSGTYPTSIQTFKVRSNL